MTMAAGFRCMDGVVLCTDSQFTAADKTYREKIIGIDVNFNAMLTFAFCGDEDYARSAIEDCKESFDADRTSVLSLSEIRRRTSLAVANMSRKFLKHGGERDQLPQFAVAVSVRNRAPELFYCREDAMPPVSVYHCVGSGNYIANYVPTAAGYRRFRLTMKDAIPMALHMVTAATRHDFGSGGGPQFMFIWGMTASGLMAWESDRSSDYIRDFEYAASSLLSSV